MTVPSSTKPPVEAGEIDMNRVGPSSRRSAAQDRETAEREALARPDMHQARRKGRTDTFSTKTKPEYIALLGRIAVGSGWTMVEAFEKAVEALDREHRGRK